MGAMRKPTSSPLQADMEKALEAWLKADSVEEYVWADDLAATALAKARGE